MGCLKILQKTLPTEGSQNYASKRKTSILRSRMPRRQFERKLKQSQGLMPDNSSAPWTAPRANALVETAGTFYMLQACMQGNVSSNLENSPWPNPWSNTLHRYQVQGLWYRGQGLKQPELPKTTQNLQFFQKIFVILCSALTPFAICFNNFRLFEYSEYTPSLSWQFLFLQPISLNPEEVCIVRNEPIRPKFWKKFLGK